MQIAHNASNFLYIKNTSSVTLLTEDDFTLKQVLKECDEGGGEYAACHKDCEAYGYKFCKIFVHFIHLFREHS